MTISAGRPAPISVAIVGTGPMARVMAEDIQRSECATAVAVVSRDRERGQAFANEIGAARALTVAELPDVDAELVYIATPHDSHASLTMSALAAGKHVLVEKAFALNAGEARQMTDAATQHGRFLMEAMWMRFNPAIQAIHAALGDGSLGEPRNLVASFGRAVPYRPGHRLWNRHLGGGSLLDQAVYPLTLADLLFGEPRMVAATGSHHRYDNTRADVETEASIVLGYETGAQAVSVSSIRAHLSGSAFIGTDKAGIEIGPSFWCPDSFTIHRAGVSPERREFPREGRGYLPMLRAVHQAIRRGQTEHSLNPLHQTVRILDVVDEARRQLER